MVRSSDKTKFAVRLIAKQRIAVLLQQAKSVYHNNPELASSYVVTARRIAMAAKIRLTAQQRRQICKKCNMLLVLGDSCRVRIKQKREPHIVITCLKCGNKTRIMLRKKKEQMKFEQDN